MMRHFWDQNGPFPTNKYFLENHYYHLHLPISPFQVQYFKRILPADPGL